MVAASLGACRGERSSLKLIQCNLHSFAMHPSSISHYRSVCSVMVSLHSSAELVGVYISCMNIHYGVRADGNASAYHTECNMSQSHSDCVSFVRASTGQLEGCTLSKSQHGDGLCVASSGSRVEALNCHVFEN